MRMAGLVGWMARMDGLVGWAEMVGKTGGMGLMRKGFRVKGFQLFQIVSCPTVQQPCNCVRE